MLQHDMELAHMVLCIRKFLTKHNIALVCYMSFIPDLAPSNFSLIIKLKKYSKRKEILESAKMIQSETLELNNIQKEEHPKCFNK